MFCWSNDRRKLSSYQWCWGLSSVSTEEQRQWFLCVLCAKKPLQRWQSHDKKRSDGVHAWWEQIGRSTVMISLEYHILAVCSMLCNVWTFSMFIVYLDDLLLMPKCSPQCNTFHFTLHLWVCTAAININHNLFFNLILESYLTEL